MREFADQAIRVFVAVVLIATLIGLMIFSRGGGLYGCERQQEPPSGKNPKLDGWQAGQPLEAHDKLGGAWAATQPDPEGTQP